VQFDVKALAGKETLRIMISGAPASGKGTQCELITAKVFFLNSFLCDESAASSSEFLN
jgi:broad-specificity NMP kinase